MELQNISNTELINRMQKLVRTERKITHLILLHILEIEARRIYADLGYDGMYTYLTRGLGYSEAAAYRRLQSARLLKHVPEVAEKIQSGALHLSQLTKVQKCIRAAADKGAKISSSVTLEILENLENKNSFQTEAVLAKKFDLPLKNKDILKPQSDDSVRLEVTLTAEQFKELQKARDYLSHVCPEGTWSQVIATLAKKHNSKVQGAPVASDYGLEVTEEENLPSRKVDDTPIRGSSTQRVSARKSGRRKAIPVDLRRALLKKSDTCCEYVHPQTGLRCDSRYQLQVDHVKPVAWGGNHNPENLRILCRTHNLLAAQKLGLRSHRSSSKQSY